MNDKEFINGASGFDEEVMEILKKIQGNKK